MDSVEIMYFAIFFLLLLLILLGMYTFGLRSKHQELKRRVGVVRTMVDGIAKSSHPTESSNDK